MRFETRRSLKTVQGEIPGLRPRLPSSESNVPLKSAAQTSCSIPVGEYLDFTAVPQAGLTKVLGRLVREDNCKLSPFPVMMLNGRPDPNSIRGAKGQSLRNFLAKPPPEIFSVW